MYVFILYILYMIVCKFVIIRTCNKATGLKEKWKEKLEHIFWRFTFLGCTAEIRDLTIEVPGD